MHPCGTRSNRFAGHLVIGTGLVLLGLLFLLRNLLPGLALPALRFWPLMLLLLAVACFVRRGWRSFGGYALLLTAAALQLNHLGHRWWPLALIWLGIAKLLGSSRHRRHRVCCQDASQGLS
jgi:hypothetical protein